jgi:hypothetical protein
VKDMQCLEKVQHRATKMGKRNVQFTEMLEKVNLYSLKYRRLQGNLMDTFKIPKAEENLNKTQFFNITSMTQLQGTAHFGSVQCP